MRPAAGDIKIPDGEGGVLRPDKFWDLYAGREYEEEHGDPSGLEIPARYFELWEQPETTIVHADASDPDANEFRETFSLVNSIVDQP
jgi:hypothetical protein